jgi:hypothetical protein
MLKEEIGVDETPEHYLGFLYDSDPNCNHELDPSCYSGIKCLKCNGWYCL